MYSNKRICLLLENPVFLLHLSLLEIFMCSRNLFKKVTPGKENQIFQQNSSPAASEFCIFKTLIITNKEIQMFFDYQRHLFTFNIECFGFISHIRKSFVFIKSHNEIDLLRIVVEMTFTFLNTAQCLLIT